MLIVAVALALITIALVRDSAARAGRPGQAASSALTAIPVPRGILLYQAALDGSGSELTDRYQIGDASASAIRTPAGALEFSVLKARGNAGAGLKFNAPARYLAEIQLAATPGASLHFWWTIRTGSPSPPPGNHIVDLDTARGTAQLIYFEPVPANSSTGATPPEALASVVNVSGLQAGKTLTLDALVDAPLYRLYVGGYAISEAHDDRIGPTPTLGFAAFGQGGTVRLTAVSIFALAA